MAMLSIHSPIPGKDLSSVVIYLLSIAIVAWTVLKYIEARKSPLNAIPTVGHSGVLTSYITAIRWMSHGRDLILEGYKKYPDRPFKVATISKWVVVLSGPQLVKDLSGAPGDVLSFEDAFAEQSQDKYTFGSELNTHPHHLTTIRNQLTRNIPIEFDNIKDEIVESFKDLVPQNEDWVSVPAYDTLSRVVTRTINRYLIGFPLCREPGYLAVAEQLGVDVVTTVKIITLFPDFLKPIVGRCFNTALKCLELGHHYLDSVVEERLARSKGNADDQPNDVITWLMETATHDYHLTARDIVKRILLINFGSIHFSTMSLTQGIYDLAIHPEYVSELREEAETVIAEHGWTKLAIQRLRKVDSFLKESHRLNGALSFVMARKARKNCTLSDGTLLPPGTYVGIAAEAMSKSESLFPDAETFKAFRFAEMRDGDNELDPIKHQLFTLNTDHIIFGHGRHACPGRFLAVNISKAIFTYILLNYDVQLENGSLERPPNVGFEASVIPNPEARVMFRKRRAV